MFFYYLVVSFLCLVFTLYLYYFVVLKLYRNNVFKLFG